MHVVGSFDAIPCGLMGREGGPMLGLLVEHALKLQGGLTGVMKMGPSNFKDHSKILKNTH